MTWTTFAKYLIGRRSGIEEIARCPAAVWLGLAFVLLAGIARDYDGEDLVAQPYWLIVPFIASAATSFLLYGLAVVIARPQPPLKRVSYQAILSLYWLTAPMAWIYAIPVERWLDACAAMSANLWLLKIIATWRVVLMTRVISVLFHVTHFFAAVIVLFFADSVVVVVSHLTPMPIWNVMGGVRLTESEAVLLNAVCATRVFSVLGWPILLIALIVACVNRRSRSASEAASASLTNDAPTGGLEISSSDAGPLLILDPEIAEQEISFNSGELHRSLWLGPMMLGLLGAYLLAVAQPEQRLRSQTEQLLLSGRLTEAIRLMSEHKRSDYPPHWIPPPRPAFEESGPSAPRMAELVLTEKEVAPWVVEEMVEKFHRYIGSWFHAGFVFRNASESELKSILFVLQHRPLPAESEDDVVCRNLRQRLDNASKPPQLSLEAQQMILEYLTKNCLPPTQFENHEKVKTGTDPARPEE